MSALNGLQFDQERINAALATDPEERRLRGFTARRKAAQQNADHWAIRVTHSTHDDLKRGVTDVRESEVHLSRAEYPDPVEAEKTAYLMSPDYPTRLRHV